MNGNRDHTMKVSLIFTMKDEEGTLDDFLSSLRTQSRMPDEIIVVDGGSTDSSVEMVENFSENCTTPVRIIVRTDANIPNGRNIAISYANSDVIASTDAGCVLDKNWFENLLRPFGEKPSVQVVAGWYEPDARTNFERIAAGLLFPRKDDVSRRPDKFLPSSRSIAFKKECWQKVNGYPEWLNTAEDTFFDIKLKEAGFEFFFAGDAVVYWRVRPNLRALFRQYFRYRHGDGMAGLFFGKYWWPRVVGYITALFLMVLSTLYIEALLGMVIGSFFYLAGQAFMVYSRTRLVRAFFVIPFIVIVVDMAGFTGYLVGLLKRNHGKGVT